MFFEKSLIETFVTKSRRQRYLNLINSERGRNKFRKYIAHFDDFDERYVVAMNSTHNVVDLHQQLKTRNAPEVCYIISENSLYDAKSMELTAAIDRLHNSGISFFLCCIAGKLYYYEGEDFNSRRLLFLPS
jgi:hypothetical protein